MNTTRIHRRTALQLLAASGLAAAVGAAPATAREGGCPDDGTPLQFTPKTAPDSEPLENELVKYPHCPYCGMDRRQWHHSRHLIHYEDGLVDATCSLHCAAISLSLNIDRGPKAIYAADFASRAEPKALTDVATATYLIGSALPGTMSKTSKMAFGSQAEAEAARTREGGDLGDFDAALRAAYLGMAEDTAMVRGRRAQRRARMQQGDGG
jgi:copper chaperone NosL